MGKSNLYYNVKRFESSQKVAEQVIEDLANDSVASITLCKDGDTFIELISNYVTTHEVKSIEGNKITVKANKES